MAKLHIDNAEYDVPDAVASTMQTMGEQLATGRADAAKLEAERDSHKDRADKAEAELKSRMDAMPAQIEAAIKSRMDLAAKAAAYGVEVKADMDASALKRAVIMHAFPKQDAAKLDNADYLAHRYDFACESLEAAKETKQDSAAPSNAALGNPHADGCGMGKKKNHMEEMEDSKSKYKKSLGMA